MVGPGLAVGKHSPDAAATTAFAELAETVERACRYADPVSYP